MLTVEEEEAKLRGESPIEVVEVGRLPPLLDYHPLITAWKPQSVAHQTMSSSSSSWARRIRNWDEKIFRPRDWSNTVLFDTGRLGWTPSSLSFWTLPLQSNEGICFGQEFKGSPCFWPKKWKNVRAGASWRCYSRGKIAPDFFQGWFCATNALRLSDQLDTPPATPFSTFFNPDRTLAVKSVKADL